MKTQTETQTETEATFYSQTSIDRHLGFSGQAKSARSDQWRICIVKF